MLKYLIVKICSVGERRADNNTGNAAPRPTSR